MSLDGISCCGYLRVSTDRQAGEAQTSLADQERAIVGLAGRLGLEVGAWYRDEGASGGTVEQRPALVRLLADCAASPRKPARAGVVLVLNDSRFGRFPDPEEAAYWRMHLKKLGWVVRFVENDDSDNLTVRSVMRSIVASQATQKREDVRANARRGSRGTAAQGFWGSRTPYGYQRRVVYPEGRDRLLLAHQRKAPDEKVILAPLESEAAIVRALFARYATGAESLASITTWLRETTQRKWTRAAVRFTLTNPAYVGDVVSGRVSGDRHERAQSPRRPDDQWVTRRDAHPAIVDRTLFAMVAEVLARNGRWTSRVRTNWLVSGLVTCPCGRPMVAGGSTRHDLSGRSYRCTSKAGIAADRCACPGAVKKEWLEHAVIDTVARFVGAPAQRARLLRHLDAALAEAYSAPHATAAEVDRQILSTTKIRDRLVSALADGTLTTTEARPQLGAARRELARLEAQRESLAIDHATDRATSAERDRIAAIALDFTRAATMLHGPALRELVRPWIAGASFDPSTRELTLDIRHIPASAMGDLEQMPCRPNQKYSRTTRRRVKVGPPKRRAVAR